MAARIDRDTQGLARGVTVALVLRVLGVVLAYGMSVAAARLLGAEGAGLFFIALSIATVASVVGRLGLDYALLRLTANYAATADWGTVAAVARVGLSIAAVALLAAGGLVLAAAAPLSELAFAQPHLALPLQLIALAIVPLGLHHLLAEMLRGIDRTAHSVLVQSVYLPAFALFGMLLLVPLLGPSGASIAYAAAATAALIVAVVTWLRYVPRAMPAAFDRSELFHSLAPMYGVAVLQLYFIWGSTILLGLLLPADDVGLYAAATRTAQLLTLFMLATNTVVMSRFAVLHNSNDIAGLEALAGRATRMMAGVTLPGVLILVAFAGPIMGLFGEEFAAAQTVLVILAIAQYVNVLTGPVAPLLLMTGRALRLMQSHAMAIAVATVLTIGLVPVFGINGGAIAFAAGLIVQNVIAMGFVRYHLGFWTVPSRPAHVTRGTE